jgi:diguanylate cyclase (GGDEF)-like protein
MSDMRIRTPDVAAAGEQARRWASGLNGNAASVAQAALHLATTLDLDEAIAIAIRHLERAVDGLPVALAVIGEPGREGPRLVVGGGPWTPALRAGAESLLREALSFRPAAEDRALVVNWAASPAPALTAIDGLEPGGPLGSASLEIGGERLGVIGVHAPRGASRESSLSKIEGLKAPIGLAIRNALQHARLRGLAFRDSLTGLYNRRAFDEMLEVQVSAARRHDRPLSLLTLDVDRLKAINDRFGHEAGDAVLREVGRILSSLVRGCDLPARTGGDEFAVILPDTGREHAEILARRLRRRLQCHVIVPGLGALDAAVSIGVASAAASGTEGIRTLRRAADDALYAEKRARRESPGAHDARITARGEAGYGVR